MWTTKVSPAAVTGSPVASISMPVLSMATCPCGSQSTRKTASGAASIVRATSSRSLVIVMGLLSAGRQGRGAAGSASRRYASACARPGPCRRASGHRRRARPRRAACPARSPGRSRGSGRPWRSPRRAPGGPPSRRPATTRRARARARGPAGRSGRGGSGAGSRLPSLGEPEPVELPVVRLVIARCSVDYVGRLTAHLPEALRLLIVKADGSVLVHSDGGSYKPLNWMSPPCRLTEAPGQWTVTGKSGETLIITLTEVVSDTSVDLGIDPGLVKDGVEAHLQELLAVQLGLLGDGWRLVRREYPTPIGPVDLMCRDGAGVSVAVEIKRRGEIDGASSAKDTAPAAGVHVAVEVKRVAGIDAVEQLTRYLELLNRDPLLRPVKGVLAAQSIRPQARTLAEDRGIRCVVLDYDAMRGIEREGTLF